MRTTIELAGSHLRIAQVEADRLISLDSFALSPEQDPVQALASAPLPPGLGKVRVLLDHPDLVLRPMVQPPCPKDRLDRLVRSDFDSQVAEGGPAMISWRKLRAGDGEDIRILGLMTRQELIDGLRQALARHGAVLDSISHPGLGLAHGYDPRPGLVVLLDISLARQTIALVLDGETVFARCLAPGSADLVTQVGSRLGKDWSAAETALARGDLPGDLRELVINAAAVTANAITAAVRTISTSLGLGDIQPESILISGAGAVCPLYRTSLAERIRIPVILGNPFAETPAAISPERLDLLAALPSSWNIVIGGASAVQFDLDALEEERATRRDWWRTDGILRVAAVAVAVIALGAGAMTELAWRSAQDQRNELEQGLVRLKTQDQRRAEAVARSTADAARVRWLDDERRIGRLAGEFLAGIATLRDPEQCPVTLTALSLSRTATGTTIELSGRAAPGRTMPEEAARTFAEGLRRLYPTGTDLKASPGEVRNGQLDVRWTLTLPNRG